MSSNRQQILDLYFVDARHKLIDLAAFLDRVERADGETDYRWTALLKALPELLSSDGRKADRAERVLLAFSDPTTDPVAQAPGKGASGAWPGSPTATGTTPTAEA
jgi:hypothetical protein